MANFGLIQAPNKNADDATKNSLTSWQATGDIKHKDDSGLINENTLNDQ